MSYTIRPVKFIEEQFDWKTDTLFSFLYKFENVPIGYKDFFYRKDIVPIVQILSDELAAAAKTSVIFPLMEDVFKSLRCSNPKVLLLGQDPYFNPSDTNSRLPGSAVGLCFSLPKNSTYINPSFQSIQKEVAENGFTVDRKCGDISRWVDEGILLLNSALTVEKNDAGSHTSIWYNFIEKFIEYLSEEYIMTWLLWGRDAHGYEGIIKNRDKQFVLKTSHPVPMAASKPSGGNPPFLGSKFCKKTNEWLISRGETVINWNIP